MKTTVIRRATEPVQDALRKAGAIGARATAPIGQTFPPALNRSGALPDEAPCPTEPPVGSGDDVTPAIPVAARPLRTCAAIPSKRQ